MAQMPSCSSLPKNWKRKADEAMMDEGVEWDSQCSPAPLKVPAVDLSGLGQMPYTGQYSFTQRGFNMFTGPAPSPANTEEMVSEDSGFTSQDTMDSMGVGSTPERDVGNNGSMRQGSQVFDRIGIDMLQQPVSLNASRDVMALNLASNSLYSLERSSRWPRSPDLLSDLNMRSSSGPQNGNYDGYPTAEARAYQERHGFPKCECFFHAPPVNDNGNAGNGNGNGNDDGSDNSNGNDDGSDMDAQ